MTRLLLVAGARPNFMKIAPIVRALRGRNGRFDHQQVHAGQHYDRQMSDVFFEELDMPKPDHYLDVGSGSHAEQTAEITMRFEAVCLQERPDLVLVVGDVNSTLACSLVAKKLHIRVAPVEAGLRSGGLQEETTALGIPCLTLRENTERPITVEQGTNKIVGTSPDRIIAAADEILNGQRHTVQRPDLWDGQAAERIVDALAEQLCTGCASAPG